MDILKERILPLLAESGKPDYELEQEIGLPKSSIYDWRSGRTQSYKKYADKIAKYFNTTSDYILGNSDIKKAPSPEGEGADPLQGLPNEEIIRELLAKAKLLSEEDLTALIALAQRLGGRQ